MPSLQLTELPIEVLTNILALLDLNDRKSVRCANKRLREACNGNFITQNEKFFLHGKNIDRLNDFMLKCDCIRTHGEFHGLDLSDEFLERIWLERGDDFRSLYFYNCHIDSSMFKSMVIHCQNLRSLTFIQMQFHPNHDEETEDHDKYESTDFLSEDVIDELLEQKIERRDLISLEVIGYKADTIAMSGIWKKIFRLYPRLRTFKERLLDSAGRKFSDYLDTPDGEESKAEWVLPPKIENFLSNRCVTANWRMPSVKFTELSIALSYIHLLNRPNCDTLIEFFSNQTELKTLKLYILYDIQRIGRPDYQLLESADMDPNVANVVRTRFSELLNVLRTLPKLNEVKICGDDVRGAIFNFKEAPAQLRNILKWFGHLESLTLDKLQWDSRYNFGTGNPSATVKKLRLDPLEITFEVLKQCCGIALEHLELGLVYVARTDRILEIISALGALRILKVTLPHSYSHITFANLENLRHLTLNGILPETFEKLPESFIFPANLTCLCISLESTEPWNKETMMRSLDVISTNLPHLEILRIGCLYYFPDAKISQLPVEIPTYCRRLTNLKFVRLWWLNNWRYCLGFEELMEKIFIECPLLRLIDFNEYNCRTQDIDMTPYTYCRSSGQLLSLSVEEVASFWRMSNFHISNIIRHQGWD